MLQLEKEPTPFALLLELTLLTYERMYEGLFINKRAFNIDAPKTYDVPETAEVKPFSISRAMKIPIKIYKIDENDEEVFVKRMKRRNTSNLVAMRNKETPDFINQVWLAKDLDENIISSFVALPGCTTWEFGHFPPDRFLPSLETIEKEKVPVNMTINNDLNTYVNIYICLLYTSPSPRDS